MFFGGNRHLFHFTQFVKRGGSSRKRVRLFQTDIDKEIDRLTILLYSVFKCTITGDMIPVILFDFHAVGRMDLQAGRLLSTRNAEKDYFDFCSLM